MISNPDTGADFLEARLNYILSLSILNTKQKMAFLLSYLGYTQQESAEIIGVSQPQVLAILLKLGER